jgi:hypothetical protein
VLVKRVAVLVELANEMNSVRPIYCGNMIIDAWTELETIHYVLAHLNDNFTHHHFWKKEKIVQTKKRKRKTMTEVVAVPKKRGRPPKKKPVDEETVAKPVVEPVVATEVLKKVAEKRKEEKKSGRSTKQVDRFTVLPPLHKKRFLVKRIKRRGARVHQPTNGDEVYIPIITIKEGETHVLKDGKGQLHVAELILKKGGTLIDETYNSDRIKVDTVTREKGAVVVTKY